MYALRRVSGLAAVLTLLASAVQLSAQTPAENVDPLIGTWILNVAKSKYKPGPPPQSQTRTFDYTADERVLCTFDVLRAKGQRTFNHWISALDGTEVPEFSRGSGMNPVAGLIFKRIDARNVSLQIKYDGEVTGEGGFSVSADGETMTQTIRGKTRQGEPREDITVYEKRDAGKTATH